MGLVSKALVRKKEGEHLEDEMRPPGFTARREQDMNPER
jgi:hypothetical protein